MSLMKIRQATMDDYDQIMTILKDGANQLAERGVDQWQGDYPSPDQIKEDIEKTRVSHNLPVNITTHDTVEFRHEWC